MWEDLGRAFCLMLILEGILPFLYPSVWRRWVTGLASARDRQLRCVGLVSMLVGLLLLYWLN